MKTSRRTTFKVLAGGALATAAAESRPASASVEALPKDASGVLYDTTKCIGCKACVPACREANSLPVDHSGDASGIYEAPTDLSSSSKNIIKLVRSGGRTSYVKRQCMQCNDPACVSACMMGALKKREKGIVTWEGNKCVGCRYCQIACPFNVPKFEWESANPRIIKCELCNHRLAEGKLPGCVEVCPRGAVIYGTREALLEEAHRRVKENPGRYYQDRIYGEHDGGGTQSMILSHLPFETIGLPELGTRGVPETVRNVQGTIYKGFIAPVALFLTLGAVISRNQKTAAAPGEEKRS